MSEIPEGLSEQQFELECAASEQDAAIARRLLAAMAHRDREQVGVIMAEVADSGRGSKILLATAVQAVRFGQALHGDEFPVWADRAALAQMGQAEQSLIAWHERWCSDDS